MGTGVFVGVLVGVGESVGVDVGVTGVFVAVGAGVFVCVGVGVGVGVSVASGDGVSSESGDGVESDVGVSSDSSGVGVSESPSSGLSDGVVSSGPEVSVAVAVGVSSSLAGIDPFPLPGSITIQARNARTAPPITEAPMIAPVLVEAAVTVLETAEPAPPSGPLADPAVPCGLTGVPHSAQKRVDGSATGWPLAQKASPPHTPQNLPSLGSTACPFAQIPPSATPVIYRTQRNSLPEERSSEILRVHPVHFLPVDTDAAKESLH